MIKFSVLIVTLNSGDSLLRTIESVRNQKNASFEIIVKDGGSTDGSIERIPNDPRIRVECCNDSGIYDAMNQAAGFASGDLAVFMNTGDLFYTDTVLESISRYLDKQKIDNTIFYGDCYTANRDSFLYYPDKFDDYTCFTKVLCHQATFYPVKMLNNRQFQAKYRIAADYEYYVNAYVNGTSLIHIPVVVVSYQGNGASETKNSRKKSLVEGNTIRKENFTGVRFWRVWIKTQLHGVGIKHFLVTQEWFYPCYKKIAEIHYRKNKLVR